MFLNDDVKNLSCILCEEELSTLERWLKNGASVEESYDIKNITENKLLDWLVAQFYYYKLIYNLECERLQLAGEIFTRNRVTDKIRDKLSLIASQIKHIEAENHACISNLSIASTPRWMIDFCKWNHDKISIYNNISKREPVYLWGESTEKLDVAIDAVKEILLSEQAAREAIHLIGEYEKSDYTLKRKYLLGKTFVELYLAGREETNSECSDKFKIMSLDADSTREAFYDVLYDAAISGKFIILNNIENANDYLLSIKSLLSFLNNPLVKKRHIKPYFPHKGTIDVNKDFGLVMIDGGEQHHRLNISINDILVKRYMSSR